jgi:hypothetical protein
MRNLPTGSLWYWSAAGTVRTELPTGSANPTPGHAPNIYAGRQQGPAENDSSDTPSSDALAKLRNFLNTRHRALGQMQGKGARGF